jgi:hypothetical protein
MKRTYLLLGILSLVVAWRVISVPRESTPVMLEEPKLPSDMTALSETKSTPSAKVEPTNAHTQANGEMPNPTEFKILLNETLLQLPTEAAVRAKGVDAHHGDPGLGVVSQPLGKIITAMKANPSLIPDGVAFYRTCALKDGLVPAVRALCLRNLFDWNERSPKKIAFSWDDYPSQIQFIAKQLPVNE